MLIKSIKLKNFKKFASDEGFEIKFPPGLAVVRAPNESGKSTIVSAITTGLFLNPKTAKIKSFQSWQSDKLPEIAIDFEDKGESFGLVKNFNTKEALLSVIRPDEPFGRVPAEVGIRTQDNMDSRFHGNDNAGDNKTKEAGIRSITNFEQIRKKIQDIFGFTESAIFESVFSVSQDAFYRLDEHKSTLQESLENLVTGGHRTVSDVVLGIEKEITDITRQGLKNPGHLQRIKGELSRIEEALSGFDLRSQRFNMLTDELSVKSKEYDELKKNLDFRKQKLKFSKEIADYQKDLDRIDENLIRLEEAYKDLAKLETELRHLGDFRNMDIDKLRDSAKDLARKVNFKKWSEESPVSRFMRLNYNILKYLFGGLALASFAAILFIGILAGLIFVLFSGLFLALAILNKKISATYQMRQSGRDLETILKKFGAKNVELLLQKINEYSALAVEEEKINHLFSRLGGEKAFFKQKEDRKNVLRLLDTARIKAGDAGIELTQSEQELKILAREIAVLEKREEELKEEAAKIRGELKGIDFPGEDKARMEEMLESFNAQLEYWQKKLKILEVARDMLISAREKTLAGIKERLSEYVSHSLALISGGKYKKISIGEDLAFKVFSDEKGSEIVPESDLSRGAIDQFYLVVRFAFAKILTGGRGGFMILDDPFHNFDGARKARAGQLLEELSKDFQIILFSHSDEYNGWGQTIQL